MRKPEGLSFDSQGNLFIAEQSTGVIWKISSKDNGQLEVFKEGMDDCEGIGHDSSDNLYIAHLDRITKLDVFGRAEVLFSNKDHPDFQYPDALYVDKTRDLIYVATEHHKSKIFCLMPTGNYVKLLDGVEDVQSLYTDDIGNLYIASSKGIYIVKKEKVTTLEDIY
jgi:DNA-binding beta-propeller fold protein YncE